MGKKEKRPSFEEVFDKLSKNNFHTTNKKSISYVVLFGLHS